MNPMEMEHKETVPEGNLGRIIIYMFWGAGLGLVIGEGSIEQNLSDNTSGWISTVSTIITLVIIVFLTITIQTKKDTLKDLALLVTAFLLNIVLIVMGHLLFAGFVQAR